MGGEPALQRARSEPAQRLDSGNRMRLQDRAGDRRWIAAREQGAKRRRHRGETAGGDRR